VPISGGQIPVRIYRPGGAGPHPVIVYFHGGGFVFGDLEIVDKVCRSWSNAAQAAVVSVGYRLAPEHRYPTAPEDCYAATCWVAANAQRLGFDTARLVTCGDSAGGNLATVVAMMARDRKGPKIAYQVLVYPVTDAAHESPSYVENGTGYLLTRASMVWFFDHYFSTPADRRAAYASPSLGDLSGLPPATVVTAGFDPLRDEGDAYALALSRAGIPVEHLRNPTMIHGFMWLMGAIGHTRSVYDQVGRTLQAVFAKRGA
jgi:acetyl esterase